MNGTKGDLHESGPAYCKTCNVVTPIHEVCTESNCWDHPAAWTHPFTPCCNGEDYMDLIEHENAVEVVEMLAGLLKAERAKPGGVDQQRKMDRLQSENTRLYNQWWEMREENKRLRAEAAA